MHHRLLISIAALTAVALFGSFAIAPEVGRGEAGESDTTGPANRLLTESSPYLQLHAYNPVDWYPWGDEAIARARRENKPIFLSIGYSTCYWCHVMEREVFSNPEIAARMNELFINIKVDREERPDLDEIYITATQLLNGSAGWPTSVFLTPDLKPFFAGTYFPPDDRSGRPGFPRLIESLSTAWNDRREEVETHASRVVEALGSVVGAPGRDTVAAAGEWPGEPQLDSAATQLKARFDAANGGFSSAPKFPSPANLYYLWDRGAAGDVEAARMVRETLTKMGRGAIYDHLDGGFHRYTLDAQWRIPHFEKMLYDNAHLGELLARVAKATGDAELERLARGTLDFVLDEMTLPNGAFKSAIDAETDAIEGAYYIWTRAELVEVLGEKGMALLGPIFGFDGEPNFEHESYTLYLAASLDEHAARLEMTRGELLAAMEPHLDRLRARRRTREFPLVDDKVLTDWNGMMISALATAGSELDEPRYIEAAELAAKFVLDNLHREGKPLLHTWRAGTAKIPAFLDDYAFLIRGLLALDAAVDNGRWLDAAEELADELEKRLGDPLGGYYFAPKDEHLLLQTKSVNDGAIPSGHSVAILSLLDLALRSGESAYRAKAEQALRSGAASFAKEGHTQPSLGLAFARFETTAPAAKIRLVENRGAKASGNLAYQALELVTGQASTSGLPLDDGWRKFRLTLTIEEGWHINANPASAKYLRPTAISGPARSLKYPEGEEMSFDFSEEPVSVYTSEALITGELDPREMKTIPVEYQVCDDRRCLPPVTQEFSLMVSAPQP